jgi:hypothetical protein
VARLTHEKGKRLAVEASKFLKLHYVYPSLTRLTF